MGGASAYTAEDFSSFTALSRCTDAPGHCNIADDSTCELAAQYLGIADTAATAVGAEQGTVTGCFVAGSGSGSLRFNAVQDGTASVGDDEQLLCVLCAALARASGDATDTSAVFWTDEMILIVGAAGGGFLLVLIVVILAVALCARARAAKRTFRTDPTKGKYAPDEGERKSGDHLGKHQADNASASSTDSPAAQQGQDRGRRFSGSQ